jgi:hypothetical protein
VIQRGTSSWCLWGCLATAACSTAPPSGSSIYTDAGNLTSESPTGSVANDAGLSLKPFTAPTDPGAGSVWVTISGEVNALTGYPFPPADWTNDTYMFDGWQFQIYEFIVAVDKLTLWSNPNQIPSDQSQHGPQVAHIDGPFIVDLHKGGTILGQGGGAEQATPIGTFTSQNDNGGAAFDPTTTYGFGFSTVQATYDAYNVNLTSDEAADFATMVQHGYSVMYVGVAQWMGNMSPYGCAQTHTGAGPAGGANLDTYVDGGYDFSDMPPTMTFRLGFSTPTSYVNCQNMTLQGMALAGEDYPRGVQVSQSQSVFAQVTVHMDHPFWESFAENTPVHWDQIAAQYVGLAGVPQATIEDMQGVPFNGFTDRTGTPLPWRNCSGMYYVPPGNGQMNFSTLSVPQNPNGTCTGSVGADYTMDTCPAIRDYYDYIRYTQSTQGHLNSQGLCFVDRRYPAPAGGS